MWLTIYGHGYLRTYVWAATRIARDSHDQGDSRSKEENHGNERKETAGGTGALISARRSARAR
jgi:hypothetical protein